MNLEHKVVKTMLERDKFSAWLGIDLMEIKKNKSPHLEPCKMNCDSGLHKKLNEYELSKFLYCHSTNMFVGAPGSGKTSLVVSLFKSSNIFYKVFIIFIYFNHHNQEQVLKIMYLIM